MAQRGTFDTAANRYKPLGGLTDDARRFQNNNADSVAGAALRTYDPNETYFQPQVNWTYKAPSAAGGGASIGGDSGGPYLTGGVLATLNANSVSVKPSYVDNNKANKSIAPECGDQHPTGALLTTYRPLLSC